MQDGNRSKVRLVGSREYKLILTSDRFSDRASSRISRRTRQGEPPPLASSR